MAVRATESEPRNPGSKTATRSFLAPLAVASLLVLMTLRTLAAPL